MAIIILIHLVGLGGLLWWAMREDDDFDWRDWWPGDDGGDESPSGRRGPGPDGIPLPDATPSAARLRDAGRIGDWRRHRRPVPAHPPEPARRRSPTSS